MSFGAGDSAVVTGTGSHPYTHRLDPEQGSTVGRQPEMTD